MAVQLKNLHFDVVEGLWKGEVFTVVGREKTFKEIVEGDNRQKLLDKLQEKYRVVDVFNRTMSSIEKDLSRCSFEEFVNCYIAVWNSELPKRADVAIQIDNLFGFRCGTTSIQWVEEMADMVIRAGVDLPGFSE